MTQVLPVGRPEIQASAALIARHIRETPVMDIDGRSLGLENHVRVKCENMQVTGSFKVRGALATALSLQPRPAGLAAASGGNHGKAVAFAARVLGIPAHIFIPASSPAVKFEGVRALGATATAVEGSYPEAAAQAEAFAHDNGYSVVHPYEGGLLLSGQGTLGLELARQSPDLETVIVAVGGGGLIGGIASWFQGDIRIVAVETELTGAYAAALHNGSPVDISPGGVCVSSLGAVRIGDYTWQIARQWIHDSVLVSDDDVQRARQLLWTSARLAVEPGGAVALAALTSGAYVPSASERVAVIICGANTDIRFLD